MILKKYTKDNQEKIFLNNISEKRYFQNMLKGTFSKINNNKISIPLFKKDI